MEKNLKKCLVVFSLVVLALFVASCAPQLDPEGNPLPKEALAGQAVYVSVSNDMLKSGVKLDQKFNSLILSPEVESANPVDFFASISSSLSYAMDQKSKQVYMPGKKLPKGWSSMSLVKPGIKYIVYMKKPGTLVYPASVVAPVSAPQVDLSKCSNSQYDYNDDGFAGKNDQKFLVELFKSKGICPSGKVCDINNNGKVDFSDSQAFVVKFQDCVNAAADNPSLEKPLEKPCIPGPTGVVRCLAAPGGLYSALKEIDYYALQEIQGEEKGECKKWNGTIVSGTSIFCGKSAASCKEYKGCVPVCTDSDGQTPSVKGTTVDESGKSWQDSCESTTSVREYFCSDVQGGGKNMDNDVMQCGNGEECKEGACVKIVKAEVVEAKAPVFSCGSNKNTVTNSTVSELNCAVWSGSNGDNCRTDNTTFAGCMPLWVYKEQCKNAGTCDK